MAYTYMYTAIAGQWFEEKGAYWVEREHKAWQKVSDVMETGKYPSWQKEPWLQHGFPMDAVREFLRVCIVDLQCVSVSRSGGVLPLQSADLFIWCDSTHTLVAATADTMELLQKFEQDPRDEPTKNTKNTKHCGDSSVFVGSKSSFANGLYRCCTHQSTGQKLAQVQALAGLYGMIAANLVAIIAYPMRAWLAIGGEKGLSGAPGIGGCLDL